MASCWVQRVYGVPRWAPIVAGGIPLFIGILMIVLGWILPPCAGYHNPSGYYTNVCHDNETAPVNSNSYYCCANACTGNITISSGNSCVAFIDKPVPILAITGFALLAFGFVMAFVSIPLTRWKIERYHELDKQNMLDPIQKAQYDTCFKDPDDDDHHKHENSRLM